MSKELAPLKALEKIGKAKTKDTSFGDTIKTNLSKAYNIIETALKEKEQQDQVLKIIKEERLIAYSPIEDNISTIGYTHSLPQNEVELLKEYFK